MENHNELNNGLKLVQKVRDICRRAAAEGKTTVRPATLRRIDRQIRQMSHALRDSQPDLFSARL
jgi:hypothetical protein